MRFASRRLIVLAAAAAAALIPAAAMASTFTLSAGAPSLTDRTLITLPVTVSCSIDPAVANFIFDEAISASVQQPAGRSFATGTGVLFGSQANLVFLCDGSTKTVTVDVLANPAGPPFHGGPAILSVGVSVTAGFEAFPGCGCGPITFSDSTTVGPQSVTLH